MDDLKPFPPWMDYYREVGASLKNANYVPKTLKLFWDELKTVATDDGGAIQEDFMWWPVGTSHEEIRQWFDRKYPGGVEALMKGEMEW